MELSLDDEDSLTERFDRKKRGDIDIAVIRYPRISNFTDLNVFEQLPQVSVRYVASVSELGNPDLVVLPGSKNTMGDLKWMRQNGLEAAVKSVLRRFRCLASAEAIRCWENGSVTRTARRRAAACGAWSSFP